MWTKFRVSKIKGGDHKESKDARRNLNVNEEYLSALRTKSYAEFFTKAQLILVNDDPTSPSFCHHKFSEILLEPSQETIPSILETTIFDKIPQLKTLILNYFDVTAEASKVCSHLLKNINQVIHSNYKFIQRAIDTIDDHNYSLENVNQIISDLNPFIIQNNPFSNPNTHDFELIHDKYLSMLHRLKLKGKKLARKIKLIRCMKRGSGICITAAIGIVAITTIVALAHTPIGLVMGPAIIGFPFKHFKTKFSSFQFMRSGALKKLRDQIDVAAKGTYILDRDFDTISRLVARLYDEVEHKKTMIKFCLERRDDKFSLEIVKELKKSDVVFRKQVEELEEQVYLCLVTINTARALVIKESMRQ